MVYLYYGVLFSHKKEGWSDTYYEMHALWKHDKWKTLDTKGYICMVPIIWIPRRGKSIETESKLMVTRSWEEEEWRVIVSKYVISLEGRWECCANEVMMLQSCEYILKHQIVCFKRTILSSLWIISIKKITVSSQKSRHTRLSTNIKNIEKPDTIKAGVFFTCCCVNLIPSIGTNIWSLGQKSSP